MRIVDRALLDSFRDKCKCEHCGAAVPTGCHPHHLWTRGMGSGGRLDIAINLIALCSLCHRRTHDGAIHRDQLLAAVARREGIRADEIEQRIYNFKRRLAPRWGIRGLKGLR